MFQRKEELPDKHGEAMTSLEFERLVKHSPHIRYEYMHGRAYAMAGGTANHSRLTNRAYRLLDDKLTGKSCYPFSDMYVRLTSDSRVLPDVVVTCAASDYQGTSTLIRSPR